LHSAQIARSPITDRQTKVRHSLTAVWPWVGYIFSTPTIFLAVNIFSGWVMGVLKVQTDNTVVNHKDVKTGLKS